jgi:hypothetical protein
VIQGYRLCYSSVSILLFLPRMNKETLQLLGDGPGAVGGVVGGLVGGRVRASWCDWSVAVPDLHSEGRSDQHWERHWSIPISQ